MYKIGDFNINVNEKFGYISKACADYSNDIQKADYNISVSQNDLNYEQENSEFKCSDGYLEFIAVHRKISEWLPLYNAIVFHSACFDIDGTGVAFTAHSGTGKTTHMNLWKKLLGNKMAIVNGDKPIVRFFDDEPEIPYAYGTPWNGKEKLGCNMRTPLKHICFIERSETNFVEPLEKEVAINRIFNQVYMPKDSVALSSTMQLVDRLLSSCKLWIIHCNMDISAAQTAYNTIFNIKGE